MDINGRSIALKRFFVLLPILLVLIAGIAFYTFKYHPEKIDYMKPTVVVSIVPQETFVKAIGRDLINVVTMVPTGSSPESYAPSHRQMEEFSRASVYFCIGVPSEQTNILHRAHEINHNIKIVNIADEVANIYPYREFEPGVLDPHVWLSPKRVKAMIDVIQRELSLLDAANDAVYQKNAQEYKDNLDKLDNEIRYILSGNRNNTFIVYHPSLGYFADDYCINMLSLEKEGKEATPKEIQSIADSAKSMGIHTIFYQAEADSRQAETFAREIGGNAEMIAPLSADYIENLKSIAMAIAKALK